MNHAGDESAGRAAGADPQWDICRTVTPGQGRAGGDREPIQPGTLVRDADGYYGIVLLAYRNGAVELFLGNGLTVLAASHTVTPLGLKIGAPASPPASFHEIIFPRERP